MDDQLLFVTNVETLTHQPPQHSQPLKVIVDDNNDLGESTASLRAEGMNVKFSCCFSSTFYDRPLNVTCAARDENCTR